MNDKMNDPFSSFHNACTLIYLLSTIGCLLFCIFVVVYPMKMSKEKEKKKRFTDRAYEFEDLHFRSPSTVTEKTAGDITYYQKVK